MAEWSKASDLGSDLFGDAGSNPAGNKTSMLNFFFFSQPINCNMASSTEKQASGEGKFRKADSTEKNYQERGK